MNKQIKQNLYSATKYTLDVSMQLLAWAGSFMAVTATLMCFFKLIPLCTANLWIISGITCVVISLVVFTTIYDVYLSKPTYAEMREFLSSTK